MTRKRNTENEAVVSPAGASPSRRKPQARTRPHGAAAERETAATPTVEAPVAAFQPAHEEIALQAYLYWEERGCEGGSPEEDWMRAEQELKARPAKVATA